MDNRGKISRKVKQGPLEADYENSAVIVNCVIETVKRRDYFNNEFQIVFCVDQPLNVISYPIDVCTIDTNRFTRTFRSNDRR